MAERMIFVREQGQVEYDILYLSETIQDGDGSSHYLTIEELTAAIKEALGRLDDLAKITLDDITIRNANGIRYMFKKVEPKLEVTFEAPSGTRDSGSGYGGYQGRSSGFQAPNVVPVAVASSYQASINYSKDNKWLTVLEKNPLSFGHSGTCINEHLFVFGGFADEETTNHCLLLSDTRGGKFSKLRVRGDIPAVRERHSASLVGKRIYIFGGYCRGAEIYYNNLYVFETETLTWTKIEPRGNPPDRRCGHSASVIDGKIWIFGGRVKAKKGGLFDSEGNGVMYKNDLHCYDPTTNEWLRYEPRGIGPSGRALHAATVVGHKIYIFGGANSTGFRNDTSGFCDLYELDIDSMSWTECETHNTPPSPCYGHSATFIGDNRILYFGGKGYQILNDIHLLDLKTMEWKQYAYAGNSLSPRWGHSATLHDTRILLYGGRNSTAYYNSIDIIDTATELIELKPEEQAKEKSKRKVEEKNRTREAIGNLQTSVSELSNMINILGEQLLGQKKLISETRSAMVTLTQENEHIRGQLIELGAVVPSDTVSQAPPVQEVRQAGSGHQLMQRQPAPPLQQESQFLPQEVVSIPQQELRQPPQQQARQFPPPQLQERQFPPPQLQQRQNPLPQQQERQFVQLQQEERQFVQLQQEERQFLPPQQQEKQFLPPQQQERQFLPPQQLDRPFLPPQQLDRAFSPPQQERQFPHQQERQFPRPQDPLPNPPTASYSNPSTVLPTGPFASYTTKYQSDNPPPPPSSHDHPILQPSPFFPNPGQLTGSFSGLKISNTNPTAFTKSPTPNPPSSTSTIGTSSSSSSRFLSNEQPASIFGFTSDSNNPEEVIHY